MRLPSLVERSAALTDAVAAARRQPTYSWHQSRALPNATIRQVNRRTLVTAKQARSAAWAKTGVIALRGEQLPLAALPPAALAAAAARVADFGNNALEALPPALGGKSCTKC